VLESVGGERRLVENVMFQSEEGLATITLPSIPRDGIDDMLVEVGVMHHGRVTATRTISRLIIVSREFPLHSFAGTFFLCFLIHMTTEIICKWIHSQESHE